MRKKIFAALLSAALTLSSLSQYVFAAEPVPSSETVSVVSESDEEGTEAAEDETKAEQEDASAAETETEENEESDASISESEEAENSEENKATAEDDSLLSDETEPEKTSDNFSESEKVAEIEDNKDNKDINPVLDKYFQLLDSVLMPYTKEEALGFMSEEVFENGVIRRELFGSSSIKPEAMEYSVQSLDNGIYSVQENLCIGANKISVTHSMKIENGIILSDQFDDKSINVVAGKKSMSSGVGSGASINAFNTNYPNTWTNTGNQAKDITEIAKTQVGYREISDHTKYNNWYYGYDNEAAWCAIFISWCANQAGIPTSVIAKNARASGYSRSNMGSNPFGCPAYAFSNTSAQLGDIVFIDTDSDGVSNHVGLVTALDANYIYTTEGNCDDKVSTGRYNVSNGVWGRQTILFYARPNYSGSIARACLDVNAKIDDTDYGWLGDYGSFDMYINDVLVADDVNDYCEELPVGTRYEIRDIRTASGYVFTGTSYGSLTGTVGGSTTIVQLKLNYQTQTISDGEYHIVSAMDWSKGIGVAENSGSANANIVLSSDGMQSGETNVVVVTYMGDGYYKMHMKQSGMVLDVTDAGMTNGTNIQQYWNNDSANQRWVIRDAGDASFYIVSQQNGLCMDVQQGNNIHCWEYLGLENQRWKFIAYGGADGQTIADGDYYVTSSIDPNYALDIYAQYGGVQNGDNLQLSPKHGGNNQIFTFTYMGNGYYSIINKNSGKALEAENWGILSGTNVWQYDCLNSYNQLWIVKPADNGCWTMIHKATGLALDLKDGYAADGTNIQLYLRNGTNAQKWHIVPLMEAPDILQAQCLNSHTLYFHWNRPAEASQVYIELYDETGNRITDFQTDALEWTCERLSAGTYTFKIGSLRSDGLRSKQNSVQVEIPNIVIPDGERTLGSGMYTIVSALDDRAQLAIEPLSSENGANVQLWTYEYTDDLEMFYVTYCWDGTYEIMNRYSGKLLDAAGQEMYSGTNVHQWAGTGNENQRWILQSTGDGYFNVICESNGLYLDAVDGRTENGTNVQLHTPNGSNAQKWKFFVWGGLDYQMHPIKDGCYQIVSEMDPGLALGIKDGSQVNGAAVQLCETSKDPSCLFDVIYLSNDYYKIVNHATGKSFDIPNGNPYSGANLQQWDYSEKDSQQWFIRYDEDEGYKILSKQNGLYVENQNAGSNVGNKIQLSMWNNPRAQTWRFIPASPELVILTQPENVEAYNGDSVSLTISVKGEDVSYQWQVSTDNGKTWTNSAESGNKSNRLSFVMKSAYRGYQYRCLVSDKNGQRLISDIVTITQGYDCHGYIGDCVSAAFVDVPNYNNYQHKPIDWAVFNKITQGSDATHFRPDLDCTRAQVVTFLWRANGMPEPKSSKNPFVDVNSSAYYYKAVLWAVEKGITTGKDATHFLPDDKVSRSQFVTFLWRAADKPEPKTTKNVFADVPSTTYYYKAVLWAAEKGITTGKDATHFLPDGTCTRGQVVTFLYRNAADK